jgi:NADPH:quinone reductase-like Zn-dependent oxidoreductase
VRFPLGDEPSADEPVLSRNRNRPLEVKRRRCAGDAAAASGSFRAFIDRILPLSHVGEAHRLVSEREAVGKVVMVPDRVFAHA